MTRTALTYKKNTVIPAICCRSGVLAAIMFIDDPIAARTPLLQALSR